MAEEPEEFTHTNMDGIDSEEEEEMEFPFLKAEHPLLARVQAALHKELTKKHEKVSSLLSEQLEEHKSKSKERESVGVSLYGVQQQLAKLQLQLEMNDDTMVAVRNQHDEAKAAYQQKSTVCEQQKEELQKSGKHVLSTQEEATQLAATLRQVEEYNSKLKTEIQVTRRATYKAADSLQKTEVSKTQQDLTLDRLNDQIRNLKEKQALYGAQLAAQKQETAAAAATLAEAATEMEAIEGEKGQLIQQWKSTLVGIQRRDDALESIRTASIEQQHEEAAIDSELRGTQLSTRGEEDRYGSLQGLQRKNRRELENLDKEKEACNQEKERLTEENEVLKKSFQQTQKETARLENSLASIEQQLQTVDSNIQKVSRENSSVTDKILIVLSQQTTLHRSATTTTKLAHKLRTSIQELEAELDLLQNEIARVKVDALNTKSHNLILKDRMKQLSEELSGKEKLVDQYDTEIRKRHNHIEKKQLNVDRLNKEFDEKRSKQEDANTGPLEAKINNLKKLVASENQECSDMRKDWIKKQTEFIKVQTEVSNLSQSLESRKDRKLVIEQRKLRLDKELQFENSQVKEILSGTKKLRFDMDRLNQMQSQFSARKVRAANDYSTAQADGEEKLQRKEETVQQTSRGIETVKKEQETMQEDLLEAERQIMLWERKISLEKEMQEALDPSIGQAEAHAMKKEIHRMQLRYEQLKKKQEQMLSEMEIVIQKRESIRTKHDSQLKGGKATEVQNQVNLRRQINSLKQSLKKCKETCSQLDQEDHEKRMQLQEMQQKILAAEQMVQKRQDVNESIRQQLLLLSVQRAKYSADILKYQKLAKHPDSVSSTKTPEQIQSALSKEEANRQKTREVLHELQVTHPHCEPLFDFFVQWCNEQPQT
eukprot:GHVQ01042058.1.p2 GENE.GHVQ01042058.1~~GHVQ01042058.1.p2  ORF type:complete len:883 (-),score=174.94 GHVQ01042058.1:4520-7168(-)